MFRLVWRLGRLPVLWCQSLFKVVSACPYLGIVPVVVNSLCRNAITHVMFSSCRSRRFVVHSRQQIVPVLVYWFFAPKSGILILARANFCEKFAGMLDRVLRGGDWELVNSETNLKTAKQITEPNYPTNLVFRRLGRQLFNFLPCMREIRHAIRKQN